MALGLSAAAYLGLAYATPRTEFIQLLALLAVAGVAYAWLLHSRLPLRWGLTAALLFRLLRLPATPALSDDFYRFRWDGLLTSHGVSAFAHTPRQLLTSGAKAVAADRAKLPQAELAAIFPQLNSPNYYSVYPPVCQLLYAAAAVFPTSTTGFLVVVRGGLLLADAGAGLLLLWLLPRAGWPARRALAYLLHPMVVVELVGNVHVEGLVGMMRLTVAGGTAGTAGRVAADRTRAAVPIGRPALRALRNGPESLPTPGRKPRCRPQEIKNGVDCKKHRGRTTFRRTTGRPRAGQSFTR